MNKPCKVDGCQKAAWARRLCWTHLQRFYRHGSTDIVKQRGRGTKGTVCRSCGKPRDFATNHVLCTSCRLQYFRKAALKYRLAHPLKWKQILKKAYWKRRLKGVVYNEN